MSNLGSLVVRLVAEGIGKYKADLNGAAKDTQDAAAKIEQSTGKAGAATGGLEEKLNAAKAAAGAASGDLMGAARGAQVLAAGAGVAVISVGLLVAGLAAVGVAAYKGSQEQLAYQKALILTGNAAGTSASQMAAMASGISRVVGTHYEAAAALTAMASTGQVAGNNLQKISQVAIEMERTVVQSVGDTVKQFAELGTEPVQASLKLNESMNYLTASTFAQIKAANDLGDTERAGSIAQNAYADAMKTRTAAIADSLGSLEKVWNSLGRMAKWTWDQMLNVGRPDGPEQLLEKAKANLALLELDVERGNWRGRPGMLPGAMQERIAAAKQEVGIAAEAVKLSQRASQIQADGVASEKAKISWMQEGDKYLSKREKMEQAIARIRFDGAAAGASQLEIEKRIAVERDNAKGKVDKSATRELEKEAALLSKLSGVNADYQQQLTRLQTMRAKGNISEAEYVELVTELISKQPVAGKQMADMAKQALELAKAQEKVLEAAYKSADSIAAQADKQEEVNATFGRGKSALAELALAQMEKSLQDLEATDNVIPGYINALELQIAAQKRLVDAVKGGEVNEANLKAAKDAGAAWKRFTDDLERGLTDSLFRAFESGKGFFDTLWSGIKNLFKTTVLKLAINGAVGGVTGALGIGGANASPGGGLMGLAQNASSLNSLWSAGSQFMTGGSAGASAASLGYANAVGAVGGDAIGALATANGGWAGVSTGAALTEAYGAAVAVEAGTAAATAASAGAATGAATGMTAALAAVPVWGWVALAGIAVLGMSGKGGGPKTESGGGYGIGVNSFGGPTADYAKGLESGYASLAKQLGLNSSLTVGAFSSQDKEGDSLTQLEVLAALNGEKVYARSTRMGGVENVGRSDAELQAAMAEEATRVMISALKASDLEQDYKDFLNTVSDSATAAALESAVNRIIAVKGFKDAIEKLPFENLKNLSFAAADGLIAAAGGLEKLSANLDTYYQNFFTAEEQRAQVIKNLFTTLGASGVDASTLYNPTIAGFRALVDAQDVTTASGQKAYAALISVSGAFAQLATTGTAATEALKQAVAADADVRKVSISGLKALSDSLKSTLDSLGIGPSRASAQSQIAAALAIARAGGGLPTAEQLAPALKAIAEPSEGLFKTFVDYRRDLLRTASDIDGLAQLADSQLSIEQQMLDALLGIDKSVLSVSAALGLVRAEKEATAAQAAQAAAAGLAAAQAAQAIAVAQASAAAAAAAQAAADAAARAAAAASPAWNFGVFDHGGGGDGGSFAIGTNYVPYDMSAKIHQGERIFPAADNRELMARLSSPRANNDALVYEVRALRSELEGLRSEARATAGHTAKTARLLDRAMPDGDALATRVAS